MEPIIPAKKVWQKPHFIILDSDNINAKTSAIAHENTMVPAGFVNGKPIGQIQNGPAAGFNVYNSTVLS